MMILIIIRIMSFARQPKKLNQQLVFNPPPGYYQPEQLDSRPAASFAKGTRFISDQTSITPGPGTYINNHKDNVKKRLIEESQKRQGRPSESEGNSNIKISSIPSIPKKSATRVYEELAPGILILHEQQYQNASIGPGSYNITDKQIYAKPITHKIAPQHRKKGPQQDKMEVQVPTINEQLRNQRRMIMGKQNIVKSSTINKSEISPSDLCLEKLLRSDDNPPPGYYHQDHLSAFKTQDPKNSGKQMMGGKQKRFNDKPLLQQLGPAAYTLEDQANKRGGFIPKETRHLHAQAEDKPGPGTYINQKQKATVQAKGNYPPIFGSGCARFTSAPKAVQSSSPGPGSYQISKKFKKQKYVKVRRDLLQSHQSHKGIESSNTTQPQFSHILGSQQPRQKKYYSVQKNSSNFASKVQRFIPDRSMQESLGPGNYDVINQDFASKTFNRNGDNYRGSRGARFEQPSIRPKLGPGAYQPAYDAVRQRKIKNVVM